MAVDSTLGPTNWVRGHLSELFRSGDLAALGAYGTAAARKRAERENSDPLPGTSPRDVPLLPPWPEGARAVPNGLLRTALFGAIAKGPRRYVNSEQIASIEGIEIRYKGERLDQGDLSAWQAVLHAVRLQELGSQCRVTSYALLKLMGKTDTGPNRKTLESRIERLVACAITIKQGRYKYMGSLIAGAAKDEETQEWVIELDPKLQPLFGADEFTQLDWAVRHALAGHQLAQWLHGYYSSHARPYPMKVETICRLCGSETAEIWKFAQTLRKALAAVAAASADHGQAFGYELSSGLVRVTRAGSAAQQRHRKRKAADSKGRRTVPAGR